MLVFVLHATDLEVVGQDDEGLGAEPRRSAGAGSMVGGYYYYYYY